MSVSVSCVCVYDCLAVWCLSVCLLACVCVCIKSEAKKLQIFSVMSCCAVLCGVACCAGCDVEHNKDKKRKKYRVEIVE